MNDGEGRSGGIRGIPPPVASTQPDDPTRNMTEAPSQTNQARKKRHRGGKKKRIRRQSFLTPSESVVTDGDDHEDQRPGLVEASRPSAARASFYRIKEGANSSTSIDSDHLHDHRDYAPARPRRRSNSTAMQAARPNVTPHRHSHTQRPGMLGLHHSTSSGRHIRLYEHEEEEDTEIETNDRSPLLGRSNSNSQYPRSHHESRRRSSETTRPRRPETDVNNPPSVPSSPKGGAIGDVMIPENFDLAHNIHDQDTVIDIDSVDARDNDHSSGTLSPHDNGTARRRKTMTAEDDVCYPGEIAESEIGDDHAQDGTEKRSSRRRRRRQWPDLDVLDEWSREEKEDRQTGNVRAKKITEPVMVGGRLRASKQPWHKEEDDAPYRYTYFNESFDATIHSRTISELCQFGASFKELFNPEAAELSESSDDEPDDVDDTLQKPPSLAPTTSSRLRSSLAPTETEDPSRRMNPSINGSPERSHSHSATPPSKAKKYGPRPTFWLDVLSPTEHEMKVLSKTFGIHQLTAEDIMMEEPREKVELFQNYYFVNYRSFEQDESSPDFMDPINIYVVVFRDGVLSFHFSMTPHPANVRRRIRQLSDYMSPSSDWISYAVIDDVTDAFAPLVQHVEEEVDSIDDAILALHSSGGQSEPKPKKGTKSRDKEYQNLKNSDAHSDTRSEKGGDKTSDKTSGDMLRNVGECRKKVMSLYRLLGNKADVIKGFAKRCNEYWEVAPRSEIGLYLGDIQDHIVTMTGNLSHYENLLSRAHSNYLAQINIRMSERAESTNDVLGKLTVLGTIVLPMNIVTGMWGMNVMVPGQTAGDLTWFWCITAGLFLFGGMCFLVAKRVYRIV